MSYSHINQGHPRFAELDGLRALAVVSVILYHCDITGVFNAGFLGVDVFFAISGFIITATLLKEYRESGNFQFRAFYFRRLKRLMPPVLALVVLASLTVFISETAFAAFSADVPAALMYASNVWQILERQAYFDDTPRVLKHLWSLAVEEQFYLLWPPLAYAMHRWVRPKSVGVLALLLACASTAWMWYLYDLNVDSADQNRIYLGPDSHAMGLLAGAALASFWNPWSRQNAAPVVRWSCRMAACASIACLGYMMLALNPSSPALYHGGFLLVPVLTGVLAYCTLNDPQFFLSRLLRCKVAQWLGSRSYSLYLVHWLVFVWMKLLAFPDFSNPVVLAGALASVGVLSELMYRWVEVTSKRFKPKNLKNGWIVNSTFAYSLATWSIVAVLFSSHNALPVLANNAPAVPTLTALEAPVQAPKVANAAQPEPAPEDLDDDGEMIAGGDDIYAIGDSVLLGARGYLTKTIPGIRVDAEVGRQASQGQKVVKKWRGKSGKASTILLHLGTNGYIDEAQFRTLLGELADRKAVIVINVHANRRWTAPNNEMIARLAPQFPNVQLINWAAVSSGRADYFVKDGIHLTTKGMHALTAQIKLATGGIVIARAKGDTMLANGNGARPMRLAAAQVTAGGEPGTVAKLPELVSDASLAEKLVTPASSVPTAVGVSGSGEAPARSAPMLPDVP
ncbi:acyltransferase family protein [Massilia sp. TWP1-3-3]|uniref:acyltransferase family protein n=1 Tax=Massilia sp. TWP1-3-3 TaxID=2804573 RepID=UPI003CE6D1C8